MNGFDPHNPGRWQRVVGEVRGDMVGEVRGEREGPTLVCVGGVHGNEPAGVLASARVVERLLASPGVLRGRFLAAGGQSAGGSAGATRRRCGTRPATSTARSVRSPSPRRWPRRPTPGTPSRPRSWS